MIYEYSVGIFVQADSEELAFEKLANACGELDELDYENETQIELLSQYTEDQFDVQFRGKVVIAMKITDGDIIVTIAGKRQ